MFGFAQTPPRPNPRMPSLEPYNPLSGTTRISPNTRVRRRPKLNLAPMNENLHDTQDPMERLDQLTETIKNVLKSYAAQPAKSQIYLANLKEFLKRAIQLDPNATEHGEEEEEEVRFNHGYLPKPHRPIRRPRRDNPSDVKIDHTLLDQLERDWWSSEVVVAWYGPRPSCNRVRNGSRVSARRESRESEREANLKRDASFVGLNEYVPLFLLVAWFD